MRKTDAKRRVANEGGVDHLRYLETYQLMAWLGISEGRVKQLVRDGMPHGKIGRKNFYDRELIANWIGSNFFSSNTCL
jgi:hypothetical protein